MSLTPEERAQKVLPQLLRRIVYHRDVEIFAAAIREAVAQEREDCALIAEQLRQDATTNHALYRDLEWVGMVDTAESIRDTIRARSETPPA